MGWSLIDFVRTALAKDEKVQEFTLKGELAQFILAASQGDGTSLIENPRDYGAANRELSAVEIRRPFFTYFLTESNARSVSARDIAWEPPRACSTDFTSHAPQTNSRRLRACFGVMPADPNGRFIYFSLRYPTPGIIRHSQGESLRRASSVLLTLVGDHTVTIRMAFEQPWLAERRYPSQLRRFAGLHEITAYSGERAGGVLRGVQGQAYERSSDVAELASGNQVTLVGRIDAALVFGSSEAVAGWDLGYFRKLRIGVQVNEPMTEGGDAAPSIFVPVGARGSALQSLEQAYLTIVKSRSLLEIISMPGAGGSKSALWSSANLTLADRGTPDTWQKISDAWANFLVKRLDVKGQVAQVEQALPGRMLMRATLTAEPILLPDLATRAFFGLSLALAAVFLLGGFWLYALQQLNVMAKRALLSARHPSSGDDMAVYAHRRDEIGMIGRTVNALVRRFRSRNIAIIDRAKLAERRKDARMKFQEQQVKAKYDVLRAIGHEIKSPLQTLLTRTDGQPDIHHEVEKMARAVEALYEAASVEAGLRGRNILPKVSDLAAFLRKYCDNVRGDGVPIEYTGSAVGVPAYFDALALDVVLSSLLDNARRHMTDGSPLKVGLRLREELVELTFANEGALIPEDDLGQIFDHGFTTQLSHSEHLGLGLFSARLDVLGMKGTIRVENCDRGVEFIITLASSVSILQ